MLGNFVNRMSAKLDVLVDAFSIVSAAYLDHSQ